MTSRRAAVAGRTLTGVALAVGAVVLAGCGSSAPKLPTPLHAAPEPGKAPAPTVAPAGTVIALPAGSDPEGAVADPGSGLVAVGLRDPDRLALLNPTTHTLTATIPVPGSARHLELAAPGEVLVPGEDTNRVSEVALPGGKVGVSVPVEKQPHDVAVVGPTDWYVADEFGPAVSHVVDGKVVATFRTGKLQPGGAAAADGTAAVVDVRARVLWLYRDGKEIGFLDAGVGPTHAVAVGGSHVVVADTSGNALLLDDLAGRGREIARTPSAGKPYGMAYDAGSHELWITQTAINRLVGYRVGATGLTQTASYPTVQDPYSVAVDAATGTVVVAGEAGAQAEFITP